MLVDFENVNYVPHSFLSVLLATPVHILGMTAYKKIKILNANPEIRETIDFIFDENTEWQAKEIGRVIQENKPNGDNIDLTMIQHISSISWDNIILYGNYILNRAKIKLGA